MIKLMIKKILQSNSLFLNKSFLINKNKYVLKKGIIFTLYSEEFKLIEIGYVKNNNVLERILLRNKFTLLDKKNGKLSELELLKTTLKELGIFPLNNLYYPYTNKTMRHLNTLNWPIGNSLYKSRRIKKEISYAAA